MQNLDSYDIVTKQELHGHHNAPLNTVRCGGARFADQGARMPNVGTQ